MRPPDHIGSDFAVCGGRAVVASTRPRVSDVLDAFAAGTSEAELLEDLRYLSVPALRAFLAFGAHATDHPMVSAGA